MTGAKRQRQTWDDIDDVMRVVKSSNEFAVRLYSKVVADSESNLFLSPSSITLALAMLYAGAGSETALEIANAVGFDLPDEQLHKAFQRLQEQTRVGGVELRIANRLWGQSGYHYLPKFLQITEQCYRAGLAQVDFTSNAEGARQQINRWVEQQTAGKIVDIVSPSAVTPMTRLVLANAIYFLGAWESEFDEQLTCDDSFSTSGPESQPIRMMSQKAYFHYGEFDGFQALELPYRSTTYEPLFAIEDNASSTNHLENLERASDFVLDIVLPRQIDGLKDVEALLALEGLPDWSRLTHCEVEVQIPRFRMESMLALDHVLQKFGLRKAFDVDEADFSQMSDDPAALYVGAALHKAFVEINEKGTEAAAATAVCMAAGCAMDTESPKIFRADHPFLFLIRDQKTKLIHFMGRLTSP
jgi:serpin B